MNQYLGRRLDGRYELQQVVGVGGMAVVFRALDLLTNMPVALKLLREEYLDNEEICRRFRNESKAIALLKHKNIVKVYDVSDSSEYLFIVMEYINGITLKDYIEQQGTLTWKETVHFMSQILCALQHAHSKGIVHRDMKPQNIMLTENGDIKVTDFGIARLSDCDTAMIGDQAIGSAHYISPEQARGSQTDERADLYSVGVMMYEMLTGRLPFDGRDAATVAVMHLQADPRMPRDINPSVPEGLEEIAMQAMQKDPERRYQTASDMLMDIEDFKRDPGIKFEYRYMVDDSPTRYINAINNTRRMQEEQIKTEKSPVIPVLSGIAVAFIVVFLVMTWLVLDESNLFSSNKNKQEAMPDFVGSNYLEVVNDKNHAFAYIVQFEFSSEYPQDSIISQKPLPNKQVYANQQVTLIVSNGIERLIVPEFTNMTYTEYSARCLELGLNPVKYEIYDPTLAEGRIKNTNPLPRLDIKEGDTIEIYVSLGPEPTELLMPNFQNMTLNEANMKLSAMGLGAAAATEVDSDKPAGTILSQKPAVGTKIDANTSVEFTLSNGKAPTGTVTLEITIPEGLVSQAVIVEIRVGDEPKFTQSVNTEETRTVQAEITDTGTSKTAMVFLNGALYETVKINFEGQEIISRMPNPEYTLPTNPIVVGE